MRSDALANQRKIVEAATRVMAEQGLEAELTDIAHEAGVGVGTVYRCVGNRDQVIETIVRDVVGQMAASFEAAEAGDGGVQALAQLVERLHGIVATYGWVHAALIGGRRNEDLRSFEKRDPLIPFAASSASTSERAPPAPCAATWRRRLRRHSSSGASHRGRR